MSNHSSSNTSASSVGTKPSLDAPSLLLSSKTLQREPADKQGAVPLAEEPLAEALPSEAKQGKTEEHVAPPQKQPDGMAAIYNRKDPTVLEVFETGWLILIMSKDTPRSRACSAFTVGIMSLALIAASTAGYLFPAMIGNIMQVATTQNCDVSQYFKDVMHAIAIPLLFSLGLMLMNMLITYQWYYWKLNLRKDAGDKMHAMLFDCNQQVLVTLLDTPDQRITESLVGFIDSVFSQNGIIHSSANSVVYLVAGVVINGTLLGPSVTAVVILVSLMQLSLEYIYGKPMQYLGQELAFVKGIMRANLVKCVSGVSTGEKVSLKTIDTNLTSIYQTLTKIVHAKIKLAFVGLASGNLQAIFKYMVVLAPTLFFNQPAPSVASLTQRSMTVGMLLSSLLSMNGLFMGWFAVCGLRNRVQDLYDAMHTCRNTDGLYPDNTYFQPSALKPSHLNLV